MPVLKHLKSVLILLIIFSVSFLFLAKTSQASAANHVVISEIQVGGTTASDEFVELYNPTDLDIDLTGWRLRVGASSNLVASMSGLIKSHGYFLVANPAYLTISPTPDMVYSNVSSSITANSFITLQSKSGTVYTTVDLVGMGTAATFEGAQVPAPAANKSIERTPLAEDTDNNLNDFGLKDVPTPHNSSFIEATPTPTMSPIESPIETPTPSPTPTEEPVPTATPTESPISTPTPESTPTEVPIPTATPTLEPTSSPTTEPTPTVLPTNSPTSSPTLIPTSTASPTASPTPKPQHHEDHHYFEHFREHVREFIHKCFEFFKHRR